jgi:hypothetical protein
MLAPLTLALFALMRQAMEGRRPGGPGMDGSREGPSAA